MTSIFFHEFILEACGGVCPGWLDFLPDLFERYPQSSALNNAVCAAAYANMAQKMDNTALALESVSFYRKSLETVNNSLSDPKTATSDVTMTAVILLGIYEVSFDLKTILALPLAYEISSASVILQVPISVSATSRVWPC